MARKIDTKKLNKIIKLRKKGLSIPEIALKLNIPKTTVFNHARNVKMNPEAIVEWKSKRGGGKKTRLLKEENALAEAKKIVETLSRRDKLLYISALYWAEGNKKDFMLSNTDPNLIKVFINSLREIFQIDNSRLRLSIRIYEDMNREKCLNFWSMVTGVPKEDFQNIYTLIGKKKGKLEYGMCRIRVIKGGDLLKQLVAINRAIIS